MPCSISARQSEVTEVLVCVIETQHWLHSLRTPILPNPTSTARLELRTGWAKAKAWMWPTPIRSYQSSSLAESSISDHNTRSFRLKQGCSLNGMEGIAQAQGAGQVCQCKRPSCRWILLLDISQLSMLYWGYDRDKAQRKPRHRISLHHASKVFFTTGIASPVRALRVLKNALVFTLVSLHRVWYRVKMASRLVQTPLWLPYRKASHRASLH